MSGDPLPEFLIASILDRMVSHDTPPEMMAQPKAPCRDHEGDEILASRFPVPKDAVEEGKRCKAECPGDIDDPRIADPDRNRPDDRHEETRTTKSKQQQGETGHRSGLRVVCGAVPGDFSR